MLTSECICTHLRRAARGVSRHYDEALAGFGINVAQFSLLRQVLRLDRPSITCLAEAMGLERSTLGRNLKVLEADGLVRLAGGDDQRNRVVLLSEAGKACLDAAYPAWQQAQRQLVERLGESQRDELVRLLEQLA
ncbi:MarR family winged helix-turn-helix transcriptional regulator [Pseudomonas mosselii]|uniref:MarR family winged helix-turn-helix transcriptional regulator n=1 Tax=Pseudomonas mosselii TaxID=78327 RepID=UPI0021DA3135|nr:MarR family winged helix-turn-helix transcriptional regulator [Pseudomonas mosselii]MCU9530131.1 MarR family winged helix-turn-helix transcriptional regulator [Pseudomonas mosselii]MCU9535597.1 MarR family winged helix-turn-helix transcriptional regulator [Pseudomonas mosselii]MCU9543293.1 MarR family winged helix-turn-helix transcriptional regulator [Pseudomonas mosselii]MCU9549133.1 MarR family winged helix-turn-helix transcriptional regulator [Pseudomonas mosselii]